MKEKVKGLTLKLAAARSGMSEKTARKYLEGTNSEMNNNPAKKSIYKAREANTRHDPFKDHWTEIEKMLSESPTLEAKTVFEYLTEQYPGVYKAGNLRTLQRRFKAWRGHKLPFKPVIFCQKYEPGRQSQSDWTHMKSLGITISGQPFDHLLYHQVLSYSGFESIMICQSESFDTLTRGFEKAALEAGGVAIEHRTDNLSAATQASGDDRVFTVRWQEFTKHYGIIPTRNNPGVSHENGIVEKSHDLFKKAVEQQLLLRRSRDFRSVEEYSTFLNKIKDKRNFSRREKIAEEQKYLRALPEAGFDEATLLRVRVTPMSLIHVLGVVYSVPSRLIGEWLKACVYRDRLELFLGTKQILTIPRIEAGVLIDYRHLIDSLIRKPGAFENYQYQSSLFPNSSFRKAYDVLKSSDNKASKMYCELLYLAKMDGEEGVTAAIDLMLEAGELPSKDRVVQLVTTAQKRCEPEAVTVPDLGSFDALLEEDFLAKEVL